MFDELAQRLFGARRAESDAILTDATTGTIHGVALTDSEGGAVTVEITADVTAPEPLEVGGETYFADAGVGVEIPTSESVRAGDEVLVSTYGAGTMRSPVVTAAVGSGDRMAAAISNAETLAQQAEAVATATGQYFWHDENGAHVTEAAREDWETSQTGPNSLWNSLGMLFRDGLNNLMAVLTSGIAIYDGNGNTADHILAEFASDEVRIGGAIPEDGSAEAAVRFFDSNADKGAMLTGYVDQSGDATQQTQDTRTQLRTRTHDADMPTTYGAAGESGLEVGQWLHAETGSYSTVESTATLTATADSGTDPTQTAHASASLGVKAVTVNDSAEEAYLTVNGNDVPMEQALAALTTPVYSNSSSVSITRSNTDTSGASVTVPAGTYILVVAYTFPTASGSGTRTTTVGAKTSGGSTLYNSHVQGSRASVRMSMFDVVHPTSTTTYTAYVAASATSSSSSLYIGLIRLS